MPFIDSEFDGARLFYRDYRPSLKFSGGNEKLSSKDIRLKEVNSPALVISHGWPMSSRSFEHIILPLVETHRYHVIAPDRRGFGHSEWSGTTGSGSDVDYEVFAQDLATVLKSALPQTGLGFVGIGASMGCSELLTLLSQDASLRSRCLGLVFFGSILPSGLPTADNPGATPKASWDAISAALRADRYGYTRYALPGVFAGGPTQLSAAQAERYIAMVDQADFVAMERTSNIVRNGDFSKELRAFATETEIPLLVVHGDMDQSSPSDAARLIQKIVPRAKLVVLKNAPHGLYATHKEECLEEILGFLRNILDETVA